MRSSSPREVDGYDACDDARDNGCEKVDEVEVRALKAVCHGKYEHREQSVEQSRESAFHRTAARRPETYAGAQEDGERLYNVIPDDERRAVKGSRAHHEGEEQHQHQGYEERDECGAQYVGSVLFEQFRVFHVKTYACFLTDMREDADMLRRVGGR